MSEIDEFWARELADAIDNAKGAGRGALADYLSLKAANDSVRQRGVAGLFDSFIRLAAEANRGLPALEIEREAPHNFPHRGANLVGALVRCRLGVRCMTVEAGWTRTPSDGFMRLGALAFARITHFGIPKANVELMLTARDDLPVWSHVVDNKPASEFDGDSASSHIELLHIGP